MSASSRKRNLFRKLKDKAYRDAYMAANIENGVAFQIRSMRQSRDWTQEELARRADKKQNTISRLEDPSYGRFSLQTLIDLASAFDVALMVKFVPYSKFLAETEDLSPRALAAESFTHEAPKLEFALHDTSGASKYHSIFVLQDRDSLGAPEMRVFDLYSTTTGSGYISSYKGADVTEAQSTVEIQEVH